MGQQAPAESNETKSKNSNATCKKLPITTLRNIEILQSTLTNLQGRTSNKAPD